MVYSCASSSASSTSISTSSPSPDPVPQNSNQTMRGDILFATQNIGESSVDVSSVACSRPQWNAVNNQANIFQLQRPRLFSAPAVSPILIPRQAVSDASKDAGGTTRSTRSLSQEVMLPNVRTESVASSLSSASHGDISGPSPSIGAAQPTSGIVDDLGSGSDIDADSVPGHMEDASSSSGSETEVCSPESIDYSIPECRKESVDAWTNTTKAITASVKMIETHVTTVQKYETKMADLKSKIEDVTAAAMVEGNQILVAYIAICRSSPSTLTDDPAAFLEL
jgi:hypothetical protein